MFELIIGGIFGAISSLLISHIYYKKSSNEFDEAIHILKNEISKLTEVSESLASVSEVIVEDTAVIRRHTVQRTSDDPQYPYK